MTALRQREVRDGAMAMVFREPGLSLNPVMTVGERIAEVLRLHGAGSDPSPQSSPASRRGELRESASRLSPHRGLLAGTTQVCSAAAAAPAQPAAKANAAADPAPAHRLPKSTEAGSSVSPSVRLNQP